MGLCPLLIRGSEGWDKLSVFKKWVLNMSYKPRFLEPSQLDEFIADLNSGMTNVEVEAKYGFSSISYAKKKLGIGVKDRTYDVDWIVVLNKLYVEEGRTIQYIADSLGCSVCTVWKHMKLLGIPRRKQGTRSS